MSIRLKTTTESSERSNFDVRPQWPCPVMRPKRVAPTAPHRGTLTSDNLHDTVSSQVHKCRPLKWVGDPLSYRGAARCHAHMASHSMLSPLGPIGRLSTPSAARSPSAPPCVPTFGDGQPDGSSRDRAAPCRTDARSAVTASAAVLGRRRATRCAAHLQNLTASTQDSCSAARALPAVATNGRTHAVGPLTRTLVPCVALHPAN